MAIIMIAAAATEGADANPVVSRAVTSAAAGPYFVAALGFAAMLAAAGLLTLGSGVFARWTGIVALVGALSFLITFLALIQGTSEDSVFGYGFLPGSLALAIWSIATSIAAYRAAEIVTREFGLAKKKPRQLVLLTNRPLNHRPRRCLNERRGATR